MLIGRKTVSGNRSINTGVACRRLGVFVVEAFVWVFDGFVVVTMWIFNILLLIPIFLNTVEGFSMEKEDMKNICGSDNWTELDLKIIQDENDIKRVASDKCALNLRLHPLGKLNKKIIDLLPKHHLKLLQISGELRQLGDDSFSSFKSLKYLNLSNTDLGKSNVFQGEGKFFKNVELLDLSYNGLNNITFFKTDSKKMRKINLNNNFLKTLPPEIRVFDNLQELSMYKNQIQHITLEYSLIDVENLDLSQNFLKNLSGLQNFPNLVHLNLTRNQIHDLTTEYFQKEQDNLQELLLDHNFIEYISISLLMNLPKLKMFSIEDNRLRKLIPTTDRYRSTKIEYMSLGSNSLDEIPYNFLKWFPSLKTFKINNNKLSYLRTGTFANLNSLRSLDLSNNKIVNFDVKRLIPLESLTFLDISNNKIEIIDYFSLALHITKLKEINIDGNSVFCDNLIETLRFFDNNDVKVKEGECKDREHLRGICCWDTAKNYTDSKFSLMSFALIKQNQKNAEKLEKLLETIQNVTGEKNDSLSSDQNGGIVITKATFWTGFGIVIVALCLILFVLVISLISKKKEILPVHL